ncbi:MAG: hypothetical protein AAGK78_04140 [Planctomycetota bacterium]
MSDSPETPPEEPKREPTTTSQTKSPLTTILAVVKTLGLLAVAILLGVTFIMPTSPPNDDKPPSDTGESTATPTLAVGDDYYAFVKLIELKPTKNGGRWDTASDSAPDIFFELYWNDTKIYEAEERDDRLIAEWDLLKLDVTDALLSGEIELGKAVNPPLVNVTAQGTLSIIVYDDDATLNDEAGRLVLTLAELRPGINTLVPDEGDVSRVLLDMVPRDISVPELIQRASDR